MKRTTYYCEWKVQIDQLPDGWYYTVSRWKFTAKYGPFIGPECTEQAAWNLIDVLEEGLEF